MRAFITNRWEIIRSSLWFVPGVFVIAAILTGALLPIAERWLSDRSQDGVVLFAISPGAARAVLAMIAGSLITVVALVFSSTFVSIQLAASRYTPRLTASFMRDRTNQVVLGLYLATFANAVVVIVQIGDGASAFVPSLSLAINVGSALASLGGFIWFMHHISVTLQLTNILGFISSEFRAGIERTTEETQGIPLAPPTYQHLMALTTQDLAQEPKTLASKAAGYLRRIDRGQLMRAVGKNATLVHVVPTIGEYVYVGSEMLRVWPTSDQWDPDTRLVRSAFVLGHERSPAEDPLFAISQLVDIALKALSPGINDQTTAIQCLDHLGSGLATLARRQLRSPAQSSADGCNYVFPEPDFPAYVDAAVGPLRRAATSVELLSQVLRVIEKLMTLFDTNSTRLAFRPHIEGTIAHLRALEAPEADKQSTLATLERLVTLLPGEPV